MTLQKRSLGHSWTNAVYRSYTTCLFASQSNVSWETAINYKLEAALKEIKSDHSAKTGNTNIWPATGGCEVRGGGSEKTPCRKGPGQG
jgi:hypothetical protein